MNVSLYRVRPIWSTVCILLCFILVWIIFVFFVGAEPIFTSAVLLVVPVGVAVHVFLRQGLGILETRYNVKSDDVFVHEGGKVICQFRFEDVDNIAVNTSGMGVSGSAVHVLVRNGTMLIIPFNAFPFATKEALRRRIMDIR
jgi:hypothetical protein